MSTWNSETRHSRKASATLAVIVSVLVSGCHLPSAHAPVVLPLEAASPETAIAFASRFDHTALSFSFSPASVTEVDEGIAGVRVRPFRTRWGTPWEREDLSRKLDGILTRGGIERPEQRVRMIAHAIVASGWRQNAWNHNIWGVRQGSWTGPYYIMSTTEEEEDGGLQVVQDAAWRSFSNWEEAIDDFRGRIRPDSRRPSYRQAFRHLVDPGFRADARYWEALGDGNYYTATHFSKKSFAMLCWAIRGYLQENEVPFSIHSPNTRASILEARSSKSRY